MASQSFSIATTFSRLQKQDIHVTVLDRDGVPDTTTALTVSSDNPPMGTIAVDPTDKRKVTLTGLNPGTLAFHVSCDLGARGGAQHLNINTTITDVDLSTISATLDDPQLR